MAFVTLSNCLAQIVEFDHSQLSSGGLSDPADTADPLETNYAHAFQSLGFLAFPDIGSASLSF